jgi:hypothetical protein
MPLPLWQPVYSVPSDLRKIGFPRSNITWLTARCRVSDLGALTERCFLGVGAFMYPGRHRSASKGFQENAARFTCRGIVFLKISVVKPLLPCSSP